MHLLVLHLAQGDKNNEVQLQFTSVVLLLDPPSPPLPSIYSGGGVLRCEAAHRHLPSTLQVTPILAVLVTTIIIRAGL